MNTLKTVRGRNGKSVGSREKDEPKLQIEEFNISWIRVLWTPIASPLLQDLFKATPLAQKLAVSPSVERPKSACLFNEGSRIYKKTPSGWESTYMP